MATTGIMKLPIEYTQSCAYALDGMPVNVSELSIVAKMLQPAAHHGMWLPPRKKSSVFLFFRAK